MSEETKNKHKIHQLRIFLKIGEVVLNYELESLAYAKSMFRKITANSARCDELLSFSINIFDTIEDLEIG